MTRRIPKWRKRAVGKVGDGSEVRNALASAQRRIDAERDDAARRASSISSDTIYLTDNGMALCGEHLGMTAKATGRDRSGMEILAVTGDVYRHAQSMGHTPACETCGKKATEAAR